MARIIRVLAPNPGPFTLEGTNTWVVGREQSVVIDPGPEHEGHLRAVLAQATPIGAILLTHRHPDHAPGARRLAEISGAPIHAFRPQLGESPLRDGDEVLIGGTALRVLHTPGHTSDHLCFFLAVNRSLFTGDTVLGRGTSVVDPPDGDMGAYVRSLRRLRELVPRTIYPGHGSVVLEATRKLDDYLAHRAQREEQILEALAGGAGTPGDIVRAVYATQTPESMFPVAARSVLAVLLKLEREGRVARRGRAGQERWFVVTPRDCQRCGRPALPWSQYCRLCSMDLLQERPER